MNGLKPNSENKHISEERLAGDKFLTEKQRRLIKYHFAVKRSLGFTESGQEDLSDQGTLSSGSEIEYPERH